MNAESGSFKSQMKKADRSEARFALILGDDECRDNKVSVKHMAGALEQQTLSWNEARDLILAHRAND